MEPKRILIVDDESGFTRLVKRTLEATHKYEVMEENDGMQALATARRYLPDLVLLDVMMPKLDGGDVARQITADPMLARTRIVFLTAIVSRNEAAIAGIGGFPFVAKPVSLEALARKIDEELASGEADQG